VASSTVERPKPVICTSVVRPSAGWGTRCISPLAASRRIACVTGDVNLQPVGRLGDRQRSAALNASSRNNSKREKTQVVGTQRGLDASDQDLVGPHHRRHRDHAWRYVTPPGTLPVGHRVSDRVAFVGFGSGHALFLAVF
jgi:hypothetical protein